MLSPGALVCSRPLSRRIDALNAAELTELQTILAAAEKLKFRAAKLNTDGVSVDPEEQRRLLRDRAWALLGRERTTWSGMAL